MLNVIDHFYEKKPLNYMLLMYSPNKCNRKEQNFLKHWKGYTGRMEVQLPLHLVSISTYI